MADIRTKARDEVNFLDLFSGIGGFALGASWAGLHFDKHCFSEVDDYAIRIYQRRFPDAIHLGDIRGVRGADLPRGEWIVAGGFPCQDISVAGKGVGLDGARSGLWFEYARLIGELRPRYAIMENVGALVSRGLDRVLGSLAALGYDAEWQDIRASDVGAPHRRERIWIVAYPGGERGEPGRRNKSRSALADATSAGLSIRGQSGQPKGDTKEGTWLESEPKRCGETLAYTPNSGNVRRDGELEPAQGKMLGHRRGQEDGRGEWWAVEPDVGRVAYGVPSRVDRLKCLGNSIVPQIAEMIFERL